MGATARVSSFGIDVADLERSQAFYTEVLGLTVAFVIDNDTIHEIALSDGQGGATVLLIRHKGVAAPAPGPKDQKIVFVVEDCAAVHADAIAAGAPSERDPAPYPGMDLTIGMVLDPDGYLVELIQM
jgi:catechol 2,3-dioxygenase-like lactoylglutathione lyase family enzyme